MLALVSWRAYIRGPVAGPRDEKAVSEQRLTRVARRLSARSSDMIYRSPTGVSAPVESVIDGLARSLAAPVSRRRAVAVIGGSMLVGTMLRPGRCTGDRGVPGRRAAHVHQSRECADLCSGESGVLQQRAVRCGLRRAVAVLPGGTCQDTPRLCTKVIPAFTPELPEYCSLIVDVTGSQTCGEPPTIKARRTARACCRQRPGNRCRALIQRRSFSIPRIAESWQGPDRGCPH